VTKSCIIVQCPGSLSNSRSVILCLRFVKLQFDTLTLGSSIKDVRKISAKIDTPFPLVGFCPHWPNPSLLPPADVRTWTRGIPYPSGLVSCPCSLLRAPSVSECDARGISYLTHLQSQGCLGAGAVVQLVSVTSV